MPDQPDIDADLETVRELYREWRAQFAFESDGIPLEDFVASIHEMTTHARHRVRHHLIYLTLTFRMCALLEAANGRRLITYDELPPEYDSHVAHNTGIVSHNTCSVCGREIADYEQRFPKANHAVLCVDCHIQS